MTLKRFQPVLEEEGTDGLDYTLNNDSCWITVENISVWIRKLDDRVIVELFPKGMESQMNPIDSAYGFFEAAGHDPKECGCEYRGNNCWSCGYMDNQ